MSENSENKDKKIKTIETEKVIATIKGEPNVEILAKFIIDLVNEEKKF